MPTVEFRTGDFLDLVGRKIPLDKIEDRASMLGTSVEEIDDERMVIEVFPNRPDMLSVEGFARAYKTFIGIDKGLKDYKVSDGGLKLTVESGVKKVRPFIGAAVVKNIPVTEEILLSIIGIQEALHGSHGRKRKKVAIGIHDFDKTKPPYLYTTKKAKDASFIPLEMDEEMTLDKVLERHPKGKEYAQILEGQKDLPLVMDGEGIVSLPPVINADRTKVETGAKNLLIEITGTNKLSVRQAIRIILSSLAERGGEIVSVNVSGKKLDMSPEEMRVDLGYVNRLLGLSLKEKDAVCLLEKMGYGAGGKDGRLKVEVPCYRTDVLHPMDVVEDIAIAYGYENFEGIEPGIATVGLPETLEENSFNTKMLLLGLGFQETVSFTLSNPKKHEKAGHKADPVKIKNPRTEEFTLVRTSLIPSLLENLAYNKKKRIPQKIFEIDDVAKSRKDWENKRMLGLALLDHEVNFSQMQSAVEALLRGLGIDYSLSEAKEGGFIPGRTAKVKVGGKYVGVFGEISAEVLESFGIDYPVILGELELGALF